MIPLATVTIRYEGLMIAVGGNIPKIISRTTPPATLVIVERMITPTMSALCSIALNAPGHSKCHRTKQIHDLDNY